MAIELPFYQAFLFKGTDDDEFLLTTSTLEKNKPLFKLHQKTTEFDFNSFANQNIHAMIMILTSILITTYTIRLM